MNTIKLTQENSRKYIGSDILFRYTNRRVCRQILRVSRSGKTIYIDYPALGNKLLVTSINIEVILDEEARLMKQLEEIRRSKEEQRIETINNVFQKLREQRRNQLVAKIRYLEYELENFDKLTQEEFIELL